MLIETIEQPICPICGGNGTIIYTELSDKMFAAPGLWRMRKCRNENCGTLWLDPKPSPHDIGKAYRYYYTHSDDFVPRETALRHLVREARGEFLRCRYGYPVKTASLAQQVVSRFLHLYPLIRTASEFSVMYLPFRANGSVLEVGCGSGYLLDNLRRMGWAKLKGVDFDSAAVEYARSKGLDVDCGGIEDVDLHNSSVDAVIMSHVIEHLYSPEQILNRAFTLLKPGGTLVLVTPNARAFGRKIFRQNWRGLEPPRHIQVFTPSSLQCLCVKSGFVETSWRTNVRGAAGMFAESMAIRRAEELSGSVSAGLGDRRMGRILQALEMLALPFARAHGEELVVVAKKPEYS